MIFKKLQSCFLSEQERWFLFTPVLLLFGIGTYFALSSEPPVWFLVTVFEALLVSIYLARKHTFFLLFLFSFLIFWSGILLIKAHTIFQLKNIDFPQHEETTYLKGTIFQTDTSAKGKTRLWLKNVSDFDHERKGIYRITLLNKKQSFQIGDTVEMAATINAPSQAFIPNDFEFNRHAFYQGISAIGYAVSGTYETETETAPSFYESLKNNLTRTRKNITSFIQKKLPQNEASIASAVLIGDKSLITDQLYTTYRNAGLAHFLAISGLHMGFIAAFAFFVIRFSMALIPALTLRYSSKKWAAVGAIILSLIYLLLSGSAVPAIRAFLMTSIVMIGILLDREAISMRMVAFAALIILLFEPYILLSPSFQMSFAAVTALVAFYEAVKDKLHFQTRNYFLKILFYFIGVCLTSFIATLATMPFALYHFGTLSPYAVLGNILAAPVIAFIIMPFIFLSLLLLPFGLASIPLEIAGKGLTILNQITSFVSDLTFSGITLSKPPLSSVLLFTIGGLWLCLWQKRWRFLGIIPIVFGIVFFVFQPTFNVLYDTTGKNVAIQVKKGELLIFTSHKNNFLNQVWQQNNLTVQIIKKLQNMPEYDLICNQENCIYKNTFRFDLKGHISFENQSRDLEKDLGGALYLKNGKWHLITVSQTIGTRPWNTLKNQ